MKNEISYSHGDVPQDSAPKPFSDRRIIPSRNRSRGQFTAFLAVMLAMLHTATAQQVILMSGQISLENASVSQLTEAELELFRFSGGNPWIANHCYELFVSSPYNDPTVYSTFLAGDAPVCEAVTEGVTATCTVSRSDTLSLIFTEVSAVASTQQSIRIKFTNFNTPFSSQVLKTINIRYYSDQFCSAGRSTVSSPSVTILQAEMPTSNVALVTSSNRLGNTTSSNYLNVTFTPSTTMAPDGKGTIEIGVPYWYILQQTGERMYNPTASNKCASSCMKITSSGLEGSAIQIKYDNMVESCIKGTPITISCRQFYNPITPEVWTGFQVTTYDAEVALRVIEQTSLDVSLDATQFLPAIIPVQNFIIDPSNTVISTFSEWTMSLKVNIPLMPECWVQIFLPPDFGYQRDLIQASGMFMREDLVPVLSDSDLNIIFTNGADIPKSSVFFQACNSEPALGREPFGRLDISYISTQDSVKDSDTFELRIWKDQAMTMLIAELDQGSLVPASNLKPGEVLDMSMVPLNLYVQKTTDIQVTFTTSHVLKAEAAVTVRLPTGITPPIVGTVLNVNSPDGSTTATTGIVQPGNMIQVQNIVPAGGVSFEEGKTITIVIQGLTNQFSAKDAGDFQITTQNKIDGNFYTVDQSTSPESYVALPGAVSPNGSIVVSNPTNNAKSNIYTLTFTLEDTVPKAGYIQVFTSPEVILQTSTTLSTASCKVYTCLDATEQGVRFLIADGIAAGSTVTLEIGGATNPRSFQPTGNFIVTTLDTDGQSLIDTGYKGKAEMTIAGPISSFSTQQTNFTNGDVNLYTFAVQALIPVIVGDKFTMTLPDEIGAPADATVMDCKPRSNIVKMSCTVSGQIITINLEEFTQPSGAFSWTISGIKNPGSTKPSTAIANVHFLDAQGYIISSFTEQTKVTNNEPADLQVYTIEQDSLKANEITSYTISFTPVNPIPATGSIQMTYPQQISLTEGAATVCTVTTTVQTYTSNCVVDDNAQTITIKDVFVGSTAYSDLITITLEKVQNAINNKPGNGFVIQTYWDPSQTFIMDKLNDFILRPQFECEYPCETCGGDRSECTTCWDNFEDPKYLMNFGNGTITCRPSCELGFSTNGTPNKECEKCSPSCLTCRDNGEVGDINQCIDCAVDHPLRISLTDTCLSVCELGMYQSTNASCSKCKYPCKGCSGTEATCTSCHYDSVSPLPFLYQNQCINKCVDGTVNIDGICTKCQLPCQLCTGTPQDCDSCDGQTAVPYKLYKKRCYADCPPGTGPDADTLTCFPCLPGCDLCDIQNKTKCLKCTAPTVVYQNECVSECPEGWVVEENGIACREWWIGDWPLVWFPFLITGLIFTIICLFGLMKKQAYLSHGKMALRAPQNTLTCIIIALAPLQFLATIAQWIFSWVYGTQTFAILALLVTLAAIIVNIAFQIWFAKHFNSKRIPDDIERRVRLNKMTREESKKHMVDRDEKFINHKRQYRCMSYIIFTLTAGCSFKFNKAYYSFFYDQKMFGAFFTQAKYYRKMMTWYQIIYLICIDLSLICIDITGLTKIRWGGGNQLYITMIETLVLSVLSIILGSFELWKLKEFLAYTEAPKNKKLLNAKNDDSSSDDQDWDKKFDKQKMKDRREMMGNLLKQVKHNKQLFLNNKLDELLTQFGDRRCKSMMDLATGWELEADPRLMVTWPISPMMRDDYADMDLKFTKEDAYGAQGNNVYADAKSKYMGMDFGTQDDAGFLEFQDALNRKAGGLMSNQMDGDLEERRMKRSNRRRGRKNKYYAQIDHEDDQEADQVEASDHEGDLQIIKEQEEEEENMRKAVQAEAAKQQDAAQARKKHQENEKSLKLAAEQAEAESRKQRANDIEKQSKLDQMAAVDRAAKAAETSKKLQEEALDEKVRREEDERKKIEDAAKQSAQARADYEKAEALRMLKLKEEQEKAAAEAELRRQSNLVAEKQSKQNVLDENTRLQAEKDAEELRKKQLKQAEEDHLRAEEKERLRLEKEAAHKAQQEKDASDRAEKERFEDERLALEQRKKEQARAEEKDRRDAEKADKAQAKDADKAQAKAEKEVKKAPVKVHSAAMPEDDEQEEKVAPVVVAAKEPIETQPLLNKLQSAPAIPLAEPPTAVAEEKKQPSPRKDNYSEMNQSMQMAEPLLEQFKAEKAIDVPPNADLRTFNVNDILGDHDRDEKGNVVVAQDGLGTHRDKQGALTNNRGYLLDEKSGAVVENLNREQMFSASEMDERGEVPGPFCVEKYNFNPHQLMGDFDYINGQPQLMQTKQGHFMDKKSRRVNKHGWMTLAGQGHLVDVSGRKKFDKCQLTKDGDLPKLYNYQGKRFDIKEVMGIFDKDAHGRIIHQNSQNGLVDNLGRRVNEKGYLIDQNGNIIDTNGKQLWRREDLKSGEFPKIFPFTKFNINRVQGDFEMNPSGNPILSKSPSGTGLVDRQGRTVNVRGYLIDKNGNVIDIRGKLMFDKVVLEQDGEIPAVFRTGLLKSDTGSELSRLMSDLDKHVPSENNEQDQEEEAQREHDGETSLDSQMEDTPANYNQANQRFDERDDNQGGDNTIPEDDEGGQHMAMQSESGDDNESQVAEKKIKKKPKKKKAKLSTIEFLQPTGREKNMAGAYGGQAIGSIRRPGIKYDEKRLENSKKFRVSTADEPKVRAQLSNLVKSQSNMKNMQSNGKTTSQEGVLVPPQTRVQGLMGVTGFDSQENRSQRSASKLRAGADSRANMDKKKRGPGSKQRKAGMKDGDFEQMFGKDIDQFLEDSEWDIESMDKVSHYSRGSAGSHQNEIKLKQMEKLYLKRLEAQGTSPHRKEQRQPNSQLSNHQGGSPPGTRPQKSKAGPDRETMINFSNDPGVIHRGEILPFHTKKTYQTKK